MEMNREELKKLEICSRDILQRAGDLIFNSWSNIQTIHYKDRRDVVTDVDVKVEEYLRDELGKLIPGAGFIVEEGVTKEALEYNWVVDPIDATKNYANNLPMFVTQVALLYKNELLMSQVYNPISKQFFSAVKGNGATLNNNPVNLYARTLPNESIIEVDFGGIDTIINEKVNVLSALFKKYYRVKVSGACLFSAYILTGAIDGFVILDPKIKSVDYLPYHLLFKEAGLITETVKIGTDYKIHITSNSHLFADLKKLVIDTFIS
jgi:myo-inositol-1(or 4)-monophosphatase